jgi:hypothetical protein
MTLTTLASVLLTVVLIGMAAASIPPLVRAAPLVQRWMLQGKRPWVCDLCMSFWSTGIATVVATELRAPTLWYLAGIPAFVVTFAIVRHNSEPLGPPPGLPPLVDSSEE